MSDKSPKLVDRPAPAQGPNSGDLAGEEGQDNGSSD